MAEPLPQTGLQALRQLVDDMAGRRAPLAAPPTAERGAAPGQPGRRVVPGQVTAPAQPTVPELDYFRDTWERQQVSRHLTRSLARPTDNAGPLNSHRLALRALDSMRQLSPAYTRQFVVYLDALNWMSRARPGKG